MKKEIRINKAELLKEKAGISYFQIFILIMSSFAFSYLIYQSSDLLDKYVADDSAKISAEKSENSIFDAVIKFIYNQIIREMFPRASAQEFTNCCPEEKGKDYLVSECQSKCSKTCLPAKCSELPDYKIGCCYDKEEGICLLNSQKAGCENKGGIWKESPDCNINKIQECKEGCCVIKGNTYLVTSKRCEKLAREEGLKIDFRAGITNQLECFALAHAQDRGACLLEGGGCKMLTSQECYSLTKKSIIKDVLCTSSFLNTSCKKTQETTCVDGKDEVYFLDSCGNPANIYDSTKINDDSYWEKIVKKEDSCGSKSINNAGDKKCGNCNYFLGSKCKNYKKAGVEKPEKGENICADLSCKQAPDNVGKKDRRNGESWCVYDGFVGEGKDVVGSRHFKYSCVEGEVKVEPCADFRNEICVQSDTSVEAGGKFSIASCRINQWQKCIDSNNKKDGCQGIDCFVKKVDVDKGFKFDVCVPKYPEGFDLSNVGSGRAAEEICGLATQKCTVVYVKDMKGKCKCVQNCECEKDIFANQMNDLCISLGDCGAYINIAGEYTSGGAVITSTGKTPKITDNYKKYAKPVEGQKAEPGTIEQLIGNFSISEEGSSGKYKGNGGASVGSFAAAGLGIGGAGLLISYLNGQNILGSYTSGGIIGALFGGSSHAASMPVPTGTKVIAEITGTASNGMPIATVSQGQYAGTYMVSGLENPEAIDGFIELSGEWLTSLETTTTNTMTITPNAIVSGFANLLMVTAIIMTIAPLIAKMLGIQTSQTGMIAGTVAGVASVYASAVAWSYATFGEFVTEQMIGDILINPLNFGGPLGIIIGIIVAAIVMAFFKAMGVGKVCKKVQVTYTCKPWTRPIGGANCDKCNEDKMKACSKYRCQSLGTACEFLNEGTSKETCAAAKNDGKVPVISSWHEILNSNFSYVNVSEKGFQIREKNGGCIEVFTPFLFGIKTDKISQCKLDVESKTKFDEMSEYFGDSNLFLFNHSMAFSMPNRQEIIDEFDLVNETLSKFVLDKIGNIRFYTRCRDVFGNYNPTEYVIDICTREGPDKTPPMITRMIPENNAFVAYNNTIQDIIIWTNEPADCKWGKKDKNYKEMENSFSCQKDNLFIYKCSTNLTNLTKGENTFYFRCKDHPELENTINKSQRNENSQGFAYKLKVSENPLTIQKIEPNGSMNFGSEPIPLDLEAKTSGGAENGKAFCRWEIGNWKDDFASTFSTIHKSTLSYMPSGKFRLKVLCIDSGSNTAEAETDFNLNVDSNPPRILRFYNSQNSLYLYTNENSECAYSTTDKNCGFIFENGTQMGGGFTQEHTAEWISQETYYIKCRDAWKNSPSSCSIKVRTYNTKE